MLGEHNVRQRWPGSPPEDWPECMSNRAKESEKEKRPASSAAHYRRCGRRGSKANDALTTSNIDAALQRLRELTMETTVEAAADWWHAHHHSAKMPMHGHGSADRLVTS